MKNFALLMGACIVVIIAGLFGVGLWQNHESGPGSDNVDRHSNTASTKQITPAYTIDSQSLAAVQSLIAQNSDLDISVAMTDLQTGKTYNYGDSSSFTAASVGKLVTTAAFMHMVEKGNASLDDSVGGTTAQKELELMIVNSDNTAWHNMEQVVTLAGQQEYADNLGLLSYNANTNTISSANIATLLAKLCGGKLLDNEHTSLLLSYMERANYRGYIVAAVPSDVTVYHKVGLLDDRLHDAAILKKGDRSFVLVIFSKSQGAYDFSRGATIFGGITSNAMQAFFGPNSQ